MSQRSAGAHALTKDTVAASARPARNSNFEALRIFAMVLIVIYHYSYHGIDVDATNVCAGKYLADCMALCGNIGVNLFVLISGYFMVKSHLKVKKLVIVYAQVFFYSVGLLLVFLFVLEPVGTISFKSVITAILPLGYYQYWFATSYIMLMAVSPALNIFIENAGRAMHKNLILVLGLFWCLLDTFLPSATYCYSSFGLFVFLYLIAAYLRLYGNDMRLKRHVGGGALLCAALLVLSVVALNLLTALTGLTVFAEHARYFNGSNSLLVVVFTVCLFFWVAQREPSHSRVVNVIASATFGVYLIHDNKFVRPYIWQTVFNNQAFYNTTLMPVHALLSIVAVYVVCTLIELARKYTIERWFIAFYDRCESAVVEKFKSLQARTD